MLHERKDTCELRALLVSSQRRQQPVLWTAKRLPSDSFAVIAVPSGGAIVLSPSLIVYQNKVCLFCAGRIKLCCHCKAETCGLSSFGKQPVMITHIFLFHRMYKLLVASSSSESPLSQYLTDKRAYTCLKSACSANF
jgi:hypothetical protein